MTMTSAGVEKISGEAHYRSLERLYLAAPVNEIYRPTIRISRGAAEIEIAADKKFFHVAGAVHGSVYFKKLDDAAFFAVNSLVQDVLVLTASFTIYFLRPIAEGTMRARGKVVHEGGSAFVAEAVLFNGENAEIGRGSGTFVKSKIKLTREMGYGA